MFMKIFEKDIVVPTEAVNLSDFGISNYTLNVRREDLLHPFISGNKFRKLKWNLIRAKQQNHETLLTFGGAYSNHITAVAAAGKEFDFKTIGLIRGEELEGKSLNPTLKFAQECGMDLKFLSREDYRKKNDPDFISGLKKMFGEFYLLPEGGTNDLAVEGCKEILAEDDNHWDFITLAVGTGGTLAGIVESSGKNQQVLGFSALKGAFQKEEVRKYTGKENYSLIDTYSFGGYGKFSSELVFFVNEFKEKTGIPLDPVYTGKMMFGIFDLMEKNRLPENSSILAIHTGGLQGITGANNNLKIKKLPHIH